MSDPRERIEAQLGIRLPPGMVEDAAALAEAASAAARAAAARSHAPADPDGFLAVLESLADPSSEGNAGG